MPALLVVVLVLVMFPLLYRSGPAGTGARMPHIDAAEIARAFTVSATGADQRGHTVIAMLIFAAIGAVAVLRRDRRTGAVVLAMTSIPIAVVVAILIATKHFFAFRYIAMALPPFLLLAGIGIATIARPRVLAPLIAVAVMTQTWTAARVEPFRKLDWRGIARAIASHAQPGDMLVVADPTADVMLRYYLGAIPHPLKIANIPYVDVAKVVVARGGPVWIATTYNTSDLSVREWSCRYPLLLANNLEGFRLHYAPSAQHFMRHRAQREELRAIASLNPLELRPGTNDELFLGEGWAAADVIDAATYRWATSTIATIFIPRGERRDRTLVFHALPFLPQRMRVELNGIPLCEQVLVEGWREYSFATPARIWIDGVNTIALRFDRTGRADGDSRPLAMLFDSIAIRDRGTPAGPPSVIPPMRLDALVDRSKDNPRAPADLLARLGLDPTLDVDLRDAALTVAWGPDCIDDATFLQRAFATLLQRGPNPIEERDLLERMRRGASRDHIVERILAAR